MFFLYLISVSIELCLQMIPKVAEQPEHYSLIALPEPFIVPGGRFREIYYWYVNLSTYTACIRTTNIESESLHLVTV